MSLKYPQRPEQPECRDYLVSGDSPRFFHVIGLGLTSFPLSALEGANMGRAANITTLWTSRVAEVCALVSPASPFSPLDPTNQSVPTT